MGTYVENNLSRNEKVVYEAHYHWKIWIELKSILTLFIRPLIMTKTDEFVITNKRVIMKTGLVSRKIFEMTVSHIESVNVDQTILGRLFSYGTVIIVGSGGTRESFPDIANPIEFRRAFMDTVE
ncbi:MAG: PH domain-containing protein [Bacteroidales bacterium]|nr:PH domain-containing protein [Bacteroidales bacterium]